MAKVDVNVPDIGDFKDVPVIEVLVKPGDVVKAEQPLVTLESDKATMDVPSPIAGAIADLHGKLLDDPIDGSGHVHRRLVGLERDQRVLGGHGVADRDQDLDDRDVVEVPDVGDLDLDRLAHSSARRRSDSTPTR